MSNVFITGTSSGFGKLITQTLLSKGHTVIATMRDPSGRNKAKADELRAFAGDAGKAGTLHILEADVTSDASVDAAVREAASVVGHIDAVVNNAGYGAGGHAEAFTVDQVRDLFDVNVLGVQRVNRAALPSMRERGAGLLVHISSTLGRFVLPFCGPYTASKYAVEGLAETYRYELSATGVDSVIVEPGGFSTDFGAQMAYPADEARTASYGPLADAPQKMWGGFMETINAADAPDPQLVADAVVGLIEAPAGTRPLRTVVDPMTGGEGPKGINQATEQVQAATFGQFGMADLLSVKPRG